MGVFVSQLNHIIAVRADRIAALWFNDNGTVSTIGFLETGMAVKPVRARLLDRKVVGVRRAGLDPDKADIRHPILFE